MSTITPTPPRIALTQCLATVASLVWAGALALTVVDAGLRDLPDPLITLAVAIAATTTIAAVQVGLSYAGQRRVIDAIDEGVGRVVEDTGSIPTISNAVADMPTVGDAIHAVALISAEFQEFRREFASAQPDNVHEMTREAYRLGRRQRSADE